MDKLLSVIIPSYNTERFIDRIMTSLLQPGTLSQVEILIIDDGSKDGTAEAAKRYQRQYSETVRVISKENGGHGSCINTGIANATGKYFRVIDGDDWVDSHAYTRYLSKLEERNEDVILSPYNSVDNDTNEIVYTYRCLSLEEGITYGLDKLRDVSLAMHALTFRTSALQGIKPISEHCFYVDVEYILYPLKFVNTVSYIDEPVYQYRVGSAEQSMALKNRQKNRNMHLHVLQNVIDFYRNDHLSRDAKAIVRNRLLDLCDMQLSIYLSMPRSRETGRDVKQFVKMIRETIPDLCPAIPGKINKAVIGSNGGLYVPMSLMFHLVRMKTA